MKTKRFALFLLLSLLLAALALPALAAEPTYTMSLTSNGSDEVYVKSGDTVTVVFTLQRTDENTGSVIYGVQNEITYDPASFELIENSIVLTPGVESTELTKINGEKCCTMAYLSLGSGTSWSPKTAVGSARFRVLAKSGRAVIRCDHARVFRPHGDGSYPLRLEDLTVLIGDKLTVRFFTDNELEFAELTVEPGSHISRPEDPEKKGYIFEGWYADEGFTRPWDFENDTVEEDLTLYARWSEKASYLWLLWVLLGLLGLLLAFWFLSRRKTVRFETDGGTEISDVHLWKGEKLEPPMNPEKAGHLFRGWYKDQYYVNQWNFETDTVELSITLYARWL